MAQPLKPFRASYTFSLEAHDLACAGKQQRDLLEAAEDLGFVLEHRALGESDLRGGAPEGLPSDPAAGAPSGGSGDSEAEAGRRRIVDALSDMDLDPEDPIHRMVLGAYDAGIAAAQTPEGSVV